MSFYPITTILAGYGIYSVTKSIPKIKNINLKNPFFFLLTILLVILFIPQVNKAPLLYDDDAHKLETIIPEKAEKDLPDNCIIIANLPPILTSTTELNVVDIKLFLANKETQEELLKGNRCLLFFEDYTCLDWHLFDFSDNCNKLKEKFNIKPFISYEEGTKKYTFYEIESRK